MLRRKAAAPATDRTVNEGHKDVTPGKRPSRLRSPQAQDAPKSLAEHADAIRKLGKRVVRDVIEIGRRLTEAKALAGRGGWLPWLEDEFSWTDDTALNYMRVYELSKSRNFRDLSLPVSALYLLAAPSTPEMARGEVIARAEAGEAVPISEVKRVIKDHRQPNKKPLPAKQHTDPSVNPISAAWDKASVALRRAFVKDRKIDIMRFQQEIGRPYFAKEAVTANAELAP
jgi:hypothetical protein